MGSFCSTGTGRRFFAAAAADDADDDEMPQMLLLLLSLQLLLSASSFIELFRLMSALPLVANKCALAATGVVALCAGLNGMEV